jgi:hypothetical protein
VNRLVETVKLFTIASKVQQIGLRAFSQCRTLRSATFDADSKLSVIEAYAFMLTRLPWIPIPESVTDVQFGPNSRLRELRPRAFCQTAIQCFSSPRELSVLSPSSFSQSKLEAVIFHQTVDTPPPYLFFNCRLLKHVILESRNTFSCAISVPSCHS